MAMLIQPPVAAYGFWDTFLSNHLIMRPQGDLAATHQKETRRDQHEFHAEAVGVSLELRGPAQAFVSQERYFFGDFPCLSLINRQPYIIFLQMCGVTRMDQKPLSPRYDVVFKNIFGERISILADFLKAVLDLPEDEYQDIRVLDPHLLRKHKAGKLGILDLRITTKNGSHIDVELQVSPQPAIWKRMLYYNARLLTDQILSGDDYGKINRAVSILISYPVLIEENPAYHNRFRLYDEKTRASYPDSLEINVLEVQKAQNAEASPLANWLRFFAAETAEEFEMTAQTSPAIAEAWGVIQYLSADEESRLLAEYEEMARRDEADRQKGAYAKGRQEGKQEVAGNLLRKKISVADVADVTGLSMDEVKRLAADLLR
jgi:predicted transposase/invertase (TIGR01784 family)